jgi:hypothetical protein
VFCCQEENMYCVYAYLMKCWIKLEICFSSSLFAFRSCLLIVSSEIQLEEYDQRINKRKIDLRNIRCTCQTRFVTRTNII